MIFMSKHIQNRHDANQLPRPEVSYRKSVKTPALRRGPIFQRLEKVQIALGLNTYDQSVFPFGSTRYGITLPSPRRG